MRNKLTESVTLLENIAGLKQYRAVDTFIGMVGRNVLYCGEGVPNGSWNIEVMGNNRMVAKTGESHIQGLGPGRLVTLGSRT